MATTTNEDDYFWIRQWGYHTRAEETAIEREIERARREKAPPNAIYWQDHLTDGPSELGGVSARQHRDPGASGVWRTTSGITDPDTRLVLEQNAGRPLPENEERGC